MTSQKAAASAPFNTAVTGVLAKRDACNRLCVNHYNDLYKVEVVGGRLKMNGQDHGPIGPGDRIKLTDKGVLTVNGAERKAAPNPDLK